MLTVSALVAQASPLFLQHLSAVNQPHYYRSLKLAPVTIVGTVNDNRATPPLIQFQVVDSFGIDQPHGTIAPQPFAPGKYLFSTRIGLSLRRRLHGVDARQYKIVVVASDADNAQTASALVRLSAPLLNHRGTRS
ncbi:MAG TPA: hypothetical protein VGY53_12940 [Isosphaeraceae bacterium]|nr:hypothetical protein [Isosphaeraceae bacterium]